MLVERCVKTTPPFICTSLLPSIHNLLPLTAERCPLTLLDPIHRRFNTDICALTLSCMEETCRLVGAERCPLTLLDRIYRLPLDICILTLCPYRTDMEKVGYDTTVVFVSARARDKKCTALTNLLPTNCISSRSGLILKVINSRLTVTAIAFN